MTEYFNVSLHPDSMGFTMHLSIGDIDVPYQHGIRVISTGCGTGKTECCKSLIRQKYNDGIVYCADSIDNVHDMYEWIFQNASNIGISINDVAVITSPSKDSLRNQTYHYPDLLNQYRDRPTELMDKKVILLTHPRFFSDLINLFLIYRPQYDVESFDGDFSKLLSRPDLRRYVLFDETPNFITPFLRISKLAVWGMTGGDCNVSLEQVKTQYKECIEGQSDPLINPFKSLESNNTRTSTIARLKRETTFGLIPKYLNKWRNDPATATEEITFTPADMDIPMNTNILIFEGAGDILFNGWADEKVIDYPGKKYNSRVDFERLDFYSKRKRYTDAEYQRDFQSLYQLLSQQQRQSKKTLVVTWKNVNGDENQTLFHHLLNDLRCMKLLHDSFDVTYFGSSTSKGSNKYCDFDNIVLWGSWSIPESETAKFNHHFNCATGNRYHVFWLYVQLILRIGIRHHDSQRSFKVYYTSDYDSLFISQLKEYINDSTFPVVLGNGAAEPMNWLAQAMANTKHNKSQGEDIKILYVNVPEIARIINSGTPGIVTLPLKWIYNLIPRGGKPKSRNYATLQKALKCFGVTLIIEAGR